MYYEIIILTVIIYCIMLTTGQISLSKLVSDNEALFRKLKESDWDFYVKARYGNAVNPDLLFNQRVRNGLITLILAFLLLMSGGLTAIRCVASCIIGYGIFKLTYMNLKSYYKKHMSQIDSLLPHYLKSIEILIQHYTVPVAIGKSISEAPEIFKPGLEDLINAINSGDDTINPYMDFAKNYPVRDSMRMMRLLYRLSLGRQERKQEQLLTFSKSISSLQQKARETRYKNRLDKMEGMTMKMLIATGAGVMLVLLLAVLETMNL